MRGNNILLVIKNKGFERGTTEVLLQLAEEIEDHNKTIKEMASAFTELVRVQTMLNGVADGLVNKMNALQRQDDEGSTRGML